MARIGRPPLGNGPSKRRQLGRWDDESWQELRDAASLKGSSLAGWARTILLREARRTLNRSTDEPQSR